MRFKSAAKPKEHGQLAIHDDGTFQIKPSPDLREEMARLEEEALEKSKMLGYGLGGVLVALGLTAIAAGWYLGRKFGQLGTSLGTPRSVGDVDVVRDESGGVHVRMQGIESKFQTIQMGWNIDEILDDEASDFLAKFEEMKRQAREQAG
jgi:hypothetical protein